MNNLKSLIILLGIWWIGVWVDTLFHLPAVIVSFGILLLCLVREWVPFSLMAPLAEVFLPMISLFFVPQLVSLTLIWKEISPIFFKIFIFVIGSYLLLFFFTYFFALFLLKQKEKYRRIKNSV